MELLAQLATALGERYRVERELGHGGMAVVFLAEDLKHRRRVAIKLLNPICRLSLAATGSSARSKSRRPSSTPTFSRCMTRDKPLDCSTM